MALLPAAPFPPSAWPAAPGAGGAVPSAPRGPCVATDVGGGELSRGELGKRRLPRAGCRCPAAGLPGARTCRGGRCSPAPGLPAEFVFGFALGFFFILFYFFFKFPTSEGKAVIFTFPGPLCAAREERREPSPSSPPPGREVWAPGPDPPRGRSRPGQLPSVGTGAVGLRPEGYAFASCRRETLIRSDRKAEKGSEKRRLFLFGVMFVGWREAPQVSSFQPGRVRAPGR